MFLMNEEDYLNNIVSKGNDWTKGGMINWMELSINKVNPRDWNMTPCNYYSYNIYKEYYTVGYELNRRSCYNYLKYNTSKLNWINNEWLPFWGDLTEKKSILLKNIKIYNNYKYLLYFKKLDFNIDIIFNIKNYL